MKFWTQVPVCLCKRCLNNWYGLINYSEAHRAGYFQKTDWKIVNGYRWFPPVYVVFKVTLFFYTLWCHRYKNLSLFPSFKITIFNIFIFCQLVWKSILYTHFNCSTWQILIVGLAFSSLKFFTRHCTIINGCLTIWKNGGSNLFKYQLSLYQNSY